MDGIDKLELEEAPEPISLANDEVLVKICRVSLNSRDVKRGYSLLLAHHFIR